MKHRTLRLFAAMLGAFVIAALWQYWAQKPSAWSEEEIAILQSMSLSALGPPPADPSNSVADDPRAATLGAQLFTDVRLSANGAISCATCHQPIRRFSDGLPKGQAIGTSQRNTMSIVGVAYSPWFYWDGRRDSLWSQALSPLEDSKEHATTRAQVAELMVTDDGYREAYVAVFRETPATSSRDEINRVFVNVGKALAAFERTLMPTKSRFDTYVDALVEPNSDGMESLLTDDEISGLRLFVGSGNCIQCHNGPLLTNNEFHNTGVLSFSGELPDKGRIAGIRLARAAEFNCQSEYNDDPDQRCDELQYARTGTEVLGALRVPSLRNLENTEPYMHKGQLETLMDVLQHYNEAPDAMIGHNEAKPLGLNRQELRQLEAFLLTLAAPVAMHPGQ